MNLILPLMLLGTLSLPYWLPSLIVALRVWIFARINGEEGIPVPGKSVDISRFKEVYASPAAGGRSQGARLSDLFWYWLAPGPEMHQEHLEVGPRYEAVAQATRHILSVSRAAIAERATQSVSRVLTEKALTGLTLVRLRDLMMPIWADFYYGLVFGEPCSLYARGLIVDNANDVISALKMTKLRNMKKRLRLTHYLEERMRAGDLPNLLPDTFTPKERAFYLQGTFFNTAVVQTSEAMAHLLLFLAENPKVQARLKENPGDDVYLEHVINESLRVHPLFGIAHRITTDEITNHPHPPIARGSVLCFNYTEYHHSGFENPQRFDPDRWESLSARTSHFMPFGSPSNRPCPAQGAALALMRVGTRELLKRFTLSSTATHTRSLPNRGPCLMAAAPSQVEGILPRLLLLYMRIRDRWEDVGRSFLQLGLGVFMIWDARRLRLCQNYFEANGQSEGAQTSLKPSRCPFAWLAGPRGNQTNP